VPELPSKLVEGLIQAGFSRERAREALTAVYAAGQATLEDSAEHTVRMAHDWLFAQNKESNMAEAAAERVSLLRPRVRPRARAARRGARRGSRARAQTDFDGYAVTWGINHLTETAEECAQRCIAYQPQGASWYACNVWVWCAAEGDVSADPTCFAPAAHKFVKGQCWLKCGGPKAARSAARGSRAARRHQDDPLNPHVNMQGVYTAEYLKRHPNAPPVVQWTGGVVVRKELADRVTNGTWSSRADWR